MFLALPFASSSRDAEDEERSSHQGASSVFAGASYPTYSRVYAIIVVPVV